MIETLMSFFVKNPDSSEGKTQEGVCPNCWGNQEYDQTIRKLYADKQIDVNNHTSHHAFIQEFVVHHVSGIQLKKDSTGMVCPGCSLL